MRWNCQEKKVPELSSDDFSQKKKSCPGEPHTHTHTPAYSYKAGVGWGEGVGLLKLKTLLDIHVCAFKGSFHVAQIF